MWHRMQASTKRSGERLVISLVGSEEPRRAKHWFKAIIKAATWVINLIEFGFTEAANSSYLK